MTNLKQMELIKSTSSPEDTLANLSPSQVEKKVKKIRDTSGQKCLDLSKNSDLLGSLEKTLVDTLNSVSTPYSRTWRVKVTPQGRLVFQLLASSPTTKEKESGLWPTPTRCNDSFYVDKSPNKDKRHSRGLASEVEHRSLWPTPNAWDGQRGPRSQKNLREKSHQINLITAVKDASSPNPVKLWPTPRAAIGMSMTLTEGMAKLHKKSYLESTVAQVESAPGGQLNPNWVEGLMGYPHGWTDLT